MWNSVSAMGSEGNRRKWEKRARHLAWKVNMGWWLDLFLPSILVLSIVGAAALLLMRRMEALPPAFHVAFGLLLCLAAGACWLRARRDFESVRDGLVRLEDTHRLHNRLSAAAEDVTDWPEVVSASADGMAWRWRRILFHPLVAVALWIAAAWIPIHPEPAVANRAVEEPLAWKQIEDWMDTLQDEEILEAMSLDAVREQVRQLRAQPMDEWYSHSGLEASDSLKQQTELAIRELERDLVSARSALAALESFAEAVPVSQQEAWTSFMEGALEGLDLGSLPLTKDMLSRLRQIDPSRLRALSKEELKALLEALKSCELACGACDGSGTNTVALLALAQTWGRGGIDRGPGEAPMALAERATDLKTSNMEAVSNPDLGRAALGDTLSVGQTDHEIDESLYHGAQASGNIASTGEGGETVWKNALMPDEQEILKRYFK